MTPLRLVVTASDGALPTLEACLAGAPVEVRRAPLAAFAPPTDWFPLDLALHDAAAAGYDALAVTSPRAAAAVAARCAALALPPDALPPCWAPGRRSAEPLAAAGARVRLASEDEVGERGAAAALAAAMVAHPDLARRSGARVLFPCGEPRRPTLAAALRAAGAAVDEVVAYRTVLATPPEARAAVAGGDAVLVASPAVALLLAEALAAPAPPAGSSAPLLVAVGPSTAEAAAGAGWPPSAVAPAPTAEAVAAEIRRLAVAHESSRPPSRPSGAT